MAEKIRKIHIKQSNGDFKEYELGGSGELPAKHDSSTPNYGIGSKEKYGHLRITNDFNSLNYYNTPVGNGESGTVEEKMAISHKGIIDLLKYLRIFSIENENEENQIFMSSINTAFEDEKSTNILTLIPSFFNIIKEDNSNDNFILEAIYLK